MSKTLFRRIGLSLCGLLAFGTASGQETPSVRAFSGMKPPPGGYITSWVGNSFGGSGGPNGFGYWVQNGADEIEVTPDGTVLAGTDWDEAGRCAGLYKDGKPGRVLMRAPDDMKETAWGWNTGNNALAVSGETIYIANTGKQLLRFAWKPGDLDSGRYLNEVTIPEKAVGLAARGKTLAIIYPNILELRDTETLQPVRRFEVKEAQDAAIARDGSLWVLAGKSIRRYSAEGRALGVALPGLQKPTALSIDPKERLIVTDDGPRQQVLIFDVSGAPRLLSAFGQKGGIGSGVPGRLDSDKLFALRGAGADAQGNLYVAMGFNGAPVGNLFLRSFTPQGKLRWELYNTAFVDTFGFDPASDGATVYSRTTRFALDLTKTKPGSEAMPVALTVDPIAYPDDERQKGACSVLVRTLQGRRALFCIGQYAGGYRIYAFGAQGDIAHEVARIGPKKDEGEQWAWDVDANGDIWHGDAPGKTIRRYAFKGWTTDGKPNYDWTQPQAWPWPEGWQLIRRIKYQRDSDTLYLSGYLESDRVETWGVAGATARRYDGWRKGSPALRWTRPLPRDGNSDPKEGPLTPSSIDIAGDYLFAGMVKPTEGKQWVHIFRVSDGGYVGSFTPGAAVADHNPGVGWLDMPYSIQAFRRKNGEYLVLVEEDWRGKNLLYRWKPEGRTARAIQAEQR